MCATGSEDPYEAPRSHRARDPDLPASLAASPASTCMAFAPRSCLWWAMRSPLASSALFSCGRGREALWFRAASILAGGIMAIPSLSRWRQPDGSPAAATPRVGSVHGATLHYVDAVPLVRSGDPCTQGPALAIGAAHFTLVARSA